MAYTHEPALTRRLPSADVHHATHIHPSHLLSSLWLRDDSLQPRSHSHSAPSHVHAHSASSASSSSATYAWQTASASEASTSQARETWNTLPQTYSLSFSDAVPPEYAGAGSHFDPDYQSAILSDPYATVTHPPSQSHSRPSSSSSLHSNLDPPRLATASWDSDLYRFDPEPEPDHEDLEAAPPTLELPVSEASRPGSPRVKQEETVSDEFVFEGPILIGRALPAYAPMTEVPLRATQASKPMRRLMGVFRLDPFAINNTARNENPNTDWSGDEIGPLAESPKTFEFQLDIFDAVKPEVPALGGAFDSSSPSPVPSSLSYPPEQEDEDRDRWDSPSQTVLSSPSIMSEPISYETVITPAQTLGYAMRYDTATSSDGGTYSSSPPASRK